MRTTETLRTAMGLLLLLVVVHAQSAHAKCNELEGAPEQKLLEYLQRERAGLQQICIVYAIDQLGDLHHALAAKTLVMYLDVDWPDSAPGVGHDVTGRTLFYPAVVALSSIGKPAIPALVRVLGDPTVSELVRKNAFQALAFAQGGGAPEAVALLVRASRAEKDPIISVRLVNSAREAAARCPNPLFSACQSALQ